MRTGGGAGRPRGRPPGRPLPRYRLSNSQPLLHRLSGARARPPARSLAGALAPPPRHVTGRARPGPRCAPRSAAGTELPLPAAGFVPRLSEQLSATYTRAGHRCRPHPGSLTEERKKLARTDAASLRGLTQVDRLHEALVICSLQPSLVSKTSEDFKAVLYSLLRALGPYRPHPTAAAPGNWNS